MNNFREWMEAGPLANRRIVIVDGSYLIVKDLSDAIEEMGGTVAGTASTLNQALIAADVEPDGAVMEVHLGHETAYPAIRKFLALAIPVLLVTTLERSSLPTEFRHLPYIGKPASHRLFCQIAAKTFGR